MNFLEKLQSSLSDRYRIEREIGAGGMATVYLARDLRHDRDVAIKLLRPELGAVLGTERFLAEIKVTARLQHPNILPLFDSGETDGQLWYVMSYVAGESLRAKMDRERQLSVKEAVRITTLIAGALDFAHRNGVIHRDLKPENILLQDGQPLVADFGIALAVSNVAGDRLTQTGLSLGTPQYMSPEQAMGERMIDARSDIYSLGAILYEMLAGMPPFSGPTTQAVIAKLVTETPKPVRDLRPAVSPAIDAAIARSLEKIPADRFDTAKEFAGALESAVYDSGGITPLRPAPKKRYGGLVVAVVATIVAVFLVRWYHGTRDRASVAADSALPAAETAKSVAVLPFVNVGGDPKQEYFSDGITDEISDALSRIPRLRIASRTSSFAYKGRNAIDARAIGKQLNVSALLEGQVLRSGDRLRVSAQLTDAGTGIVKWRNKYERDLKDVFAVQDEIARSIASALQVTLADSTHLVSGTTSVAAHDYYLRGHFEHYRYDEGSIKRGIALYDSAIKLDPHYVDAYVGVGQAWWNLADDWVAPVVALPHGDSALRRALELDPSNGRALAASLFLQMASPDAERIRGEAEEALRLAPNDPNTLVLASAMLWERDTKRSLEIAKHGFELDPHDPYAGYSYSQALFFNRRYDEALKIADASLADNPSGVLGHFVRGLIHLALERPADALLDFAAIRYTLQSASKAGSARAYAALGKRDKALELIHELESDARKRYVDKTYIGGAFAAIGERDSAFTWLEKAFADKSSYARLLEVDPTWNPLRSDPRYADLVQRMKIVIPPGG